MKKILIFKLGTTFACLATRRGDFEDWIMDSSGLAADCFQVVDATKSQTLPDPRGFAGVILTGSHEMVSQRAPWSEAVAAWIPGIAASGIPLLGICYGHQLIAHALGGRVGDNPNGIEVGAVLLRLTSEGGQCPLFRDFPSEWTVFAAHAQSVISLPRGAVRLASSAMDPNHAFAVGETVWGVQFHPEFDGEIVRTYIHEWSEELIRKGQDPAEQIRGVGAAERIGVAVLKRFNEIAIIRSR